MYLKVEGHNGYVKDNNTGIVLNVNKEEVQAARDRKAAKHLTKEISLANDAVGLKVLINANKPTGTDFRLYFRTSDGDAPLYDKDFTLATIESPVATTDNALSYSQHIFLIGGKNGSLPSFTKFQLKIVFTSTNRAKVSTLSSLRAIAMST